ncbi:MAG: hypothetical protein QNK23_01460 [Crocinitomicaceae bacterium]|nr:hypothetical protein [Crocinitomicaceae bacterium]
MRITVFFSLLFVTSFCIGQERAEAIVWDGDILDLKTLTMLPMHAEKPEFVWDLDKLIASPVNHTDIGVDTLEFEKWRLQYRITLHDYFTDDAITGYSIVAETMPKPKAGWKYTTEQAKALGRNMQVIFDDNKLIVAVFSPIASGCDLVCINLQTGREIWHAEVEQLLVDHSQYLNNVYLDKFDDKIVLVGNEIGGAYVQIFDSATGKNLFTRTRSK